MKKLNLLVSIMVFAILFLFGCNKNEPNIPEIYDKGVHKIVIEITGDKEVSWMASFAGVSEGGLAKLYDESNTDVSQSYLVEGNAKDNNRVFCKTDNNGRSLVVAFTLSCTEEVEKKATYTVSAYINEKLVDKVSKTKTFSKDEMSDVVTISTIPTK